MIAISVPLPPEVGDLMASDPVRQRAVNPALIIGQPQTSATFLVDRCSL